MRWTRLRRGLLAIIALVYRLAPLLLALSTACSFDGAVPTVGNQGVGPGDGGPSGSDGATIDGQRADASTTAPRKSITVAPGKTLQDLVNFPMYVGLLDDGDLRDSALADGSDIFFEASDGSALDYEIENWDQQKGKLDAWVRVPTISAATGVVIYLRYGDASIASAPNPSAVWGSDFLGVWHLSDDPASGAANAIVDSVGLRNGTAHSSMTNTALVDGALAGGLQFDGADDEVLFDNPLLGTSSHTISAWVNQDATNNNDALVVLGNGACNQSRWIHSRFSSGKVATGFYCDDWTTSRNIQGDGWKLLHWTYDDSENSRMFLDGSLIDGPFAHIGNQETAGSVGRIGNAPGAYGPNMGLNGIVDEVRITAMIRTDAWIQAEFDNQGTPQTFYLLGPQEP